MTAPESVEFCLRHQDGAMVARRTVNADVAGSSPAPGAEREARSPSNNGQFILGRKYHMVVFNGLELS